MRLKVDEPADALYLSLIDGPSSRCEELAPGIIVDYDEQDQAIGIEMLYLSKRAPQQSFRSLLFESVPLAS